MKAGKGLARVSFWLKYTHLVVCIYKLGKKLNRTIYLWRGVQGLLTIFFYK